MAITMDSKGESLTPFVQQSRFGAGIAVVLGAVLFIYSQLVVRRELIAPASAAALTEDAA